MIFKNFLSYALFSLIASGVGFLTTMYLAKVLSPSALGMVGIFQTILFATTPIVTFSGLGLVAINKVKYSPADFQVFANNYFSLSSIIGLILLTFIFIFVHFYLSYIWVITLAAVMAFIKVYSDFYASELVQEHKSRQYGIYSVLESTLGLVFTVILVSLLHLSWLGRILSLVFAALCILLVQYFTGFNTLNKIHLSLSKKEIVKILKYGWPLMIALCATWVLNNADRFVVLHYFSLHEVGIYTFAVTIGGFINLVNQATINALAPIIYQRLHAGNAKSIITCYNFYYSLFILSLACIIGFGSYWYVPIIFDSKYQQSEPLILWIALAYAFMGTYRTTGIVVDFYKATKLKTMFLYMSAITFLVVSLMLMPSLGIKAPAIGSMLAWLVLSFLSYKAGFQLMKANGVS